MTTAGLEPATFWYRRQSKPNALPLRQVAILKANNHLIEYVNLIHVAILGQGDRPIAYQKVLGGKQFTLSQLKARYYSNNLHTLHHGHELDNAQP